MKFNWIKSYYRDAVLRGNDWCGTNTAKRLPQSILDAGCADGLRLLDYLTHKPAILCGCDVYDGRSKNTKMSYQWADLNSHLPYPDRKFDVIHCNQVIEHLHNTLQFARELFRVLKPGGRAYLTSENITSLLNLASMILGYAPTSMTQVCGHYIGNPISPHAMEEVPHANIAEDHPTYPGNSGHVRVLSATQAKELFELVGFKVSVRSIGLMPLPEWVGLILEPIMPRRGHILLIEATKP